MALFVPGEEKVFEKQTPKSSRKSGKEKINEKYDTSEQRIVTETNREKLPLFVKGVVETKNIDPRPSYQRRPRWTPKQKSRLIESFVMNLPVPPIFIYENSLNKYEIVDGQQRVTALLDFYSNKFKLTGLRNWPELNGFTYKTLPQKIRDGIDRRSISSITLMTESAKSPEEAFSLKREVFERLNTGGVKLSAQEIRNCLAESGFNEMIKELARLDLFTMPWGIPAHSDNDMIVSSREFKLLQKNKIYSTMQDVELVLRFFVLRHYETIYRDGGSGGLKRLLDKYMLKAIEFDAEQIKLLRAVFTDTINLAEGIFKELLFRAWREKHWDRRRYKELYDAVMVGLSRNLEHKEKLIENRNAVIEATKLLLERDKAGIYIGKGKTKSQIKERIDGFDSMLRAVLSS